jgi:hypothetical protein
MLFTFWPIGTASVLRSAKEPRFEIMRVGRLAFPYLQDALEYGYWDMIATLLMSDVKNNLSGLLRWSGAVKLVLSQSRSEAASYLQLLKDDFSSLLPAPIAHGIQLRLKILDDVLGSITGGLSSDNHLKLLQDDARRRSVSNLAEQATRAADVQKVGGVPPSSGIHHLPHASSGTKYANRRLRLHKV